MASPEPLWDAPPGRDATDPTPDESQPQPATNVTDVQEQDQEGAEEVSGDTGELSDDDADVPDVQEQNQEGAEKALGDKGELVGIKDDDGQVLGYASADDDDDDDDKLESLRKIFTCAPQLAEVSSKSYMMSLETKTNLKWGIRWIKFDTQENVKDMVRHLFGVPVKSSYMISLSWFSVKSLVSPAPGASAVWICSHIFGNSAILTGNWYYRNVAGSFRTSTKSISACLYEQVRLALCDELFTFCIKIKRM
eukprot:scaffold1325_cov138-Amphora_coffeaeformis.AAC.14